MTILCLSVLFFVFFAGLLFYSQIINADAYSYDGGASSYSVSADAPRGEILDRNGNALVYNEQINTLVICALTFPEKQQEKNEVIFSLIKYIESQNEEWFNNIPLFIDKNGTVQFQEERDTDIKWLKSASFLELNSYATAADCLEVLKETYALEDFSDADALKIASVYYGMKKLNFSVYQPYTFAENVSVRSIAYIKENSDIFRGIDAQISSVRKYVGDGTLAAHILGVTGAISAQEYSAQKEKTQAALSAEGLSDEQKNKIENMAYSLNDIIGKNGIESAMESYLRGTKGTKLLSEVNGAVKEAFSVLPQSGGTVMLTIDQKLQEIADASLKRQILAVTEQEALASGLTAAGAVVIQDVNTGAILASSSYPNFSLATYQKDYASLAEDPGKPLWNRAFQSTYSPGSTMKPVIALAALEEGIITPDSTIYCQGTYKYIDQTFVCYKNVAHGNINVKQALEHSCNIFFFELARQLGIDKMNTYSSLFGLGQKTGVEISEEEGILAGITYRDSLGLGWKAGETLLAAIGQSDNSFSPLQLVNYCSAIANGGTRYVPYLIDSVLSSDYRSTLYEREPEIAVQTNVSQSSLDAVKSGMYLVANEGSCKATLGNLKYKVACKTGTAEKSKIIDGVRVDGTDGFLISFGPYDDAQIAIAVVIENAGSGSSTAQIAADIYEYYFSSINAPDNVQAENTIIW